MIRVVVVCCLLCLEQTGLGSKVGCCLLLALCCGLVMVGFGSSGACLLVFFAEDECFRMVELAVGVTS